MRKNKTFNLTLLAVFTALIVLQSYVPNLGYIRIIPALPAISTIVITVSIGGSLLGTASGAILGLIWGSISLLMAYTQPADPISLLLFQNPVIAIVPRILVGFFTGLISSAFRKRNRTLQTIGLSVSGAVGALTNTFFVILLSSLFYMGEPNLLTSHLGAVNEGSPLILILLVALSANGIAEAIASAILTPIIVTPLQRVLKRIRGN